MSSESYSEEEDEELCLLDVSFLRYNLKRPPKCDCNIAEILDYTYSTILLHRGRRHKDSFSLLVANRPFIEQIVEDVFWLTHSHIYHDDCVKEIDFLTTKIGMAWGQFCFPFETDTKIDPVVREIFFDAIPYFFTQVVQHIYIKISHGNPATTSKFFRLKVCSYVVTIFTSIHRLESQLEERLGSFFEKAPPTDTPDHVSEAKKEEENDKTTLIPSEDLTTLIEMQRRRKPKNTRWNMSGMSSLISASTHRRTLPYEHDSEILVQYPAEGESDWTTQLPPLLPPDTSMEIRDMTIEKYDPMKEPRSLLQRSRRPFLTTHIALLKSQFQKEQRKQGRIHSKIHKNNKEMRKALLATQMADVDAFIKDLRNLQLENKRNETPELVMERETGHAAIGGVKIGTYQNESSDKSTAKSAPMASGFPNVSFIANRQASEQQIDDQASDKSEKEKEKIVLFDPTIYLTFELNL